MKPSFTLALLAFPLIVSAQSTTLTGRYVSTEALLHKAANQSVDERIILPPMQPIDTLYTPDSPFTSRAISMHGYSKQLGDTRESFVLRNETQNYRISRVTLRLVYSLENGRQIYRRKEVIECDLAPGSVQQITIKSFDPDKRYYYFQTHPTRDAGTPFRVQYDVLRYDVVVDASNNTDADK